MANITVAIDEEVLRRARVKATEQRTSVNALIAEYLAQYVAGDPAPDALAGFLELAERAGAGSGEGGRRWTRDDLYE